VVILGPAPRFRLEGRSLQFGPRNDELAVYRGGQWQSAGSSFPVLESESPTLIHFEQGEMRHPVMRGPFPAVQVANGVIRWGSAAHQVVAVFDDATDTWRLSPSGAPFEVVVLASADEDSAEDEISADDFVRDDSSCSRPSVRSASRHSRASLAVGW
jgi:hypothetical protein